MGVRKSALGLVVLAFAIIVGCSSTGGGCAGLQPLPNNARYQGPKTDNVVNFRLSPGGINYLNSNWRTLIDMFAPGQVIHFPVPCTRFDVGISGVLRWVLIANQGGANCTSESCGRMDGICDARDVPADVTITVTGFQLVPSPPDKINGTLRVSVNTGKVYVDTEDRTQQKCLIYPSCWSFLGSTCPVKCSVLFNSARASPSDNRMVATVKFTIDTRWDKLLAFSVENVDGAKICGASGAPPSGADNCLEPSDLSLNGENSCGGYCDAVDWDPVKTFLLQMISPTLEQKVRETVAGQSCEKCGTGLKACPTAGTATSTCQNGVCMDGQQCVPRFLGVEGRVTLSDFMGSFGVPPTAQLDMSIAAGSSVAVDQGISIGTRGGITSLTPAPCVAPLPAPAINPVPPPDFDADAARAPLDASGYHVGLGLSQSFLNLAMHHAQQSGALCINVNSSTVGVLNSGLFKTFLPSLGKLVTRDGKDAPMMIVLRPAQVPTITVGEGTYDPATKRPVKPLLLIKLPDISVDFYAMLDDRYARLFTVTADISLPLSLIFNGCSSVQPALGDLKQLITNVRTANSEMLAEDPKVLADLIPAVIGLAEPAVAGALQPFTMPDLGTFKLKVNATKGVGNIAGTETYNHLGIYATLLPAGAACAVSGPTTQVALKRSIIPAAADMRLRGQPLPWPVAVLDVRALGVEGTAEFAYRVDQGLWSTFLLANAQHELEVSHPAFLLQGQHVIEVRSRLADDPHGISAPVAIGFQVDWEPPEVSLHADRDNNRLLVEARDVISPPEKLTFAYAVGEGAFSDFGPTRLIDLAAIEAAGGLEVRVRDELGNVGEAAFRVPGAALHPESEPAVAADSMPNAGCTSTGGLIGFAALGLLGLLCRRRGPRSP
ncbi:MAG: hypothetical protein ACOZIN_03020 [Myxococcota bacterium]